MMKKSCCLALMMICLGWSVAAQRGVSFTKKNSLSFFYTPMYAKTNFTNLDQVISLGSIRRVFETAPPKRGIYGNIYGLRYARRSADRWWWGLSVQYAKFGQRSPSFYSINGISDNVLDNLPDYGGTFYKITYQSYEFSPFIKYQLPVKGRIRYFLQLDGIFNIYYRVHNDRYIISRSTGKQTPTIFSSYAHAVGGLFKELQQHIGFGMWRLGFSLGAGMEYELWPFLSLSASPEFRYYGNLIDTSEASTIVEGDIYSIGMALSTHIKF